jgi:hypothetical protein
MEKEIIFCYYLFNEQNSDNSPYKIFVKDVVVDSEGNLARVDNNGETFYEELKVNFLSEKIEHLFFQNYGRLNNVAFQNDFLNYHFYNYLGDKANYLNQLEFLTKTFISREFTPSVASGIIAEIRNGLIDVKRDTKVKFEMILDWVNNEQQRLQQLSPSDFNLEWNNKTELVELIYALSKSGRVRRNGVALKQTELISLFSHIFSVDLKNFHNLLSDAVRAQKRERPSGFFMTELRDHIVNYATKKVRE